MTDGSVQLLLCVFTVKCHYGNNLYGSKNQEKTDQIHTGELGSQKDPRQQGT